ncbi:hypothetical protein JVT61DRAFT_6655 [Boletus reticuloceps]|uniref:Wax synthase domain-containing protein n=1 Tax=Boletus reticuloceps TaxID=495285 RepID=A0A8I2YKP3_9AGAM|nr:hypothetical protein JVT61DRAFT_6655 [Boletus reticuloceps]
MTSASSTALYLWNALGVPSTRIPIDNTTFISHVLPLVLFYFASAVLAVTPQTHAVRVALWPLIALLTLRTVLSVDMSSGKPEYSVLDTIFVVHILCAATRSLGWTLAKGPLVRHLRPRNSSPSTIMDALDLVSSYRGHEWELSRRLYIPHETRPANRMAFALYASVSAVANAFIHGVFGRAVMTMLRVGVGEIRGSTLFDETLPLWLRYLRACTISILSAIGTYSYVQMMYDLCTVPGIIFLGQDPAQWPPAFNAPWRATSLSDFWGRRWHQFLRQVFLLVGGYPLSLVLGPSGIVIGAFLASVLLHYILLLTLSGHGEFWWMFVGFGMMAPGILVERAFHQLTGRCAGGVVGWVWTMAWLLVWGNVIFEGFARVPVHRSTSIDDITLVWTLVERLVTSFDNWLHTI